MDAPLQPLDPQWTGPLPAAARPAPPRCRSWTLALPPLLLFLAAAAAQAQALFGTQPVGVTAGEHDVTVTAQAAGVVAQVQVLTLGASGLDFAPGIGSQNCLGATVTVGSTCTESVAFTPAAPGARVGAVVLLNSGSEVLATTYISGMGWGGLGVLVPGNVLSVAGQGRLFSGPLGDGGLATSASLNLPASVTLDGNGDLYIADSLHQRIRLVNAKTGIISTFAGDGNPGYSGDNGPAATAALNAPSGVTLDGAGNLYIADAANNVVRKVTAATGIITTAAGTGTAGSTGDGAAATAAELNQPEGVTVDVNGNLYIADTSNHRIRRVDAVTGIITTVAGNGTTNPATGAGGYTGDNGPATRAELNFPYTVAFDAAGNMYIPDSANNVARKVAAVNLQITAGSMITTFAGTSVPGYTGDGGSAASATLFSPESVALDAAGNLYIADTQNAAIRKVSSATGFISTLAANAAGETLNNNNFTYISIYGPIGLFLDGAGNLYFADYYNQQVQEIQSNFAALDFTKTPIRQGGQSTPQIQTVEDDGNAPFDVTAISLGQNAALDPATSTCVLSPPLMSVDGDCAMGVVFAPSSALVITPPPQQQETGTIDVGTLGDTVNAPLDIEAIGIATVVNATTTTLVSSLNPSGYGQSVSFTATVTTGVGTGTLTGAVTFSIDGAQAPSTAACPDPVTLNAADVAVCATAALTVGLHEITASYADNNTPPAHFPSTSATLSQTVLEGTATALASSQNPSAVGQSVTFTATVTVPAGGGNVPPDGNVVFYDGSTVLGSIALNTATGVAALTTAVLADGLHDITAVYGGDAVNQIEGSSSPILRQDVLANSGITVASNLNPSDSGVPVTFTVTIPVTQTAAPTGAVDIQDGGTKIGSSLLAGATGQATFTTSTLAVGSHSITASYPGDTNYGPGVSPAITQVVNQVPTTTAVAAAPSPAFAGGGLAITATVKATQGTNTLTGTVTFTNGAVILGSAALSATGTATIHPTLAAGAYSVVATYAGDANDLGSPSSPLALTVQLAITSSAVTATPNPALVDSPIALSAKVTGNGGIPTGPVTFTADGASIGAVPLDATGSATMSYSTLAAGAHSIVASYAGDANDLPSVSPALSLVVGTIPTTTSQGATSSTGTTPQVSLVATVIGSSGPVPSGTVTFSNGPTVIGAATLNSSGVATLSPNLATGSYTIVAVYSGDALHSPSTSLPVTISGAPTDFNITLSPPSVTMAVAQNATVTVTLTSISGFADTLGLGCATLPKAVTCHFSSPTMTLAANGVQTAQLTIDTNNPLSGGTTALNAQTGNRGAALAGLPFLSLPLSVFFACIVCKFRKRHALAFTAVLALLLTGAALLLNGCTGFSQATASPGSYVIQVTATGASSNVTHYQNLTVTITQ